MTVAAIFKTTFSPVPTSVAVTAGATSTYSCEYLPAQLFVLKLAVDMDEIFVVPTVAEKLPAPADLFDFILIVIPVILLPAYPERVRVMLLFLVN